MSQTPSPHIDQVRQSLLDTLADLRNRDTPMDSERAKAVATVASVLVDTVKVENDYLKITGQDRSSFLGQPAGDGVPRLEGPAAHNPFPVSASHRLQG
jgi:hypothetical protein